MKNKLVTKRQYDKARIIVKAYQDQKEIEDEKKMRQENQELLGSFWIYKNNSYSCPSDDKDYWNMYRKVIAFSKDGRLLCEDYEIDSHGRVNVIQHVEGSYNSSGFHEGWKQITEEEFITGSRKVLEKFSFSDDITL